MYLITGAGGFLGGYVIREMIAQGVDPREIVGTVNPRRIGGHSLPLPEKNVVGIDVTERCGFVEISLLPEGEKWDAVIHCAAALMIDGHSSRTYYLVNALGTENALEWARNNGARRFIYTHTHSDMNRYPMPVLIDGMEPTFGLYTSPTLEQGKNTLPFIQSKIAGARAVMEYARHGAIEGAVLRLSNIRGVGSKDTKYGCVFHSFIQKAMRDEPIEIWGEHETRRDFIYVKDVARAIWLATQAKHVSGIYNIGSGTGLQIDDEAVDIIRTFSPTGKTPLVYRPEIPEVRKHSLIFNCERARREFGWKPQYSYREGLEDMKTIMGVKNDAG